MEGRRVSRRVKNPQVKRGGKYRWAMGKVKKKANNSPKPFLRAMR